MPRRTRVAVEVQLYSFFNLGARWGGWLTPRHGRFTSGKETRYPLYRREGGTQGWSGRVRKILTPPEFDPRTIHTPAGRCTDWAIQAPKNIYRYDSCSNKGFTEKWQTHFMSKCYFHWSRHNWHVALCIKRPHFCYRHDRLAVCRCQTLETALNSALM